MEVILLFTVNCPRCCAMAPSAAAPKHCHTRPQPLCAFTVGLQFHSAWKTAGEKTAPTPPPLKQDSLEPLLVAPLCNLSQKNPYQGGAPHIQSIFPLLNCFPLLDFITHLPEGSSHLAQLPRSKAVSSPSRSPSETVLPMSASGSSDEKWARKAPQMKPSKAPFSLAQTFYSGNSTSPI